jgi:hypothetical protein
MEFEYFLQKLLCIQKTFLLLQTQSQTKRIDSVAQLVEHLTFNERVLGSSPSGITMKAFHLEGFFAFYVILKQQHNKLIT